MDKLASTAAALDAADDLTPYRARIHLPEGVVYLDGNSLGAMPVATPQHMADAVTRAWGQRLIASWMEDGWWQMPVTLGDRLAPVIGAGPGQTVVADGTSVSIFKAVHAALSLRPERTVIVSERASFPTDLYIVEGLIASSGRKLELRLAEDAGAGLDAVVTSDAERFKWLPGSAAYVTALVWLLFRGAPRAAARIEHEDGVLEEEIAFVTVCNGQWLGGTFHFAPRARIDDGQLAVVASTRLNRGQIVRYAPKVMRGQHEDLPVARVFEARRLRVELDRPLILEADGEIRDRAVRLLEVEILPGALGLLA